MAASLAVAMISDFVREPGDYSVLDTGKRLRLLTDLVREWSKCEQIDQFLDRIAQAAVTLTGARRAVVILTSMVENFQVASFAHPDQRDAAERQQFNGQLVEQVVLSGRAVYAREIHESQPLGRPEFAIEHPPRTVGCIPLDAGRRQIGVLYVEHPEPPGQFDSTDFELLEMVALHGAIAIENIHNLTRATTDPLTRVFTHRHFMMLVDHELRQSRREGISNALLLFDLDRFKQINDSLGHAAGNDYIVQYADFLRANIRSSDVLGRFGGDEFEILLPNTQLAGAEAFAQKLMNNLKKVRWNHHRVITNSIGIALYTDHAEQAEMLFQKADEALYEAKAHGRNCYIVAHSKAADGKGIDWSLDGAKPLDPAKLQQLRRTARRRTPPKGNETPILPFPGVAIMRLFETNPALTQAQILAASGLSAAAVAQALKQLQTAGRLKRTGRGKAATWQPA